jgi:hypothetical protein
MAEEVNLAESVFRSHLSMGPFQSGVERKRWRIVDDIDWPHAIIAVSASPRERGPSEFIIRFDVTNYPQDAPTADLWDIEKGSKLDASKRPQGERRVALAFRADRNSLYLPCDRQEISGHQDWRDLHPSMLWSPEGDITQYLRIVYDLLNCCDYTGVSVS